MRPFLPVMMAWLALPAIRLAFWPSGRLTATGLVVPSARCQDCPSASRRRNPWLRAWAWMMRMPGSCLTCAGSAFPILLASQVQACPSVSTMRIRPGEEMARTACACPGRRRQFLPSPPPAGSSSWTRTGRPGPGRQARLEKPNPHTSNRSRACASSKPKPSARGSSSWTRTGSPGIWPTARPIRLP